MIEMCHVDMTYNLNQENEVQALRDVSLTIPAGDFAAVVGPSGSGKSTLMYVIGGLLRPQRGKCTVNGHELSRMSPGGLAAFRNNEIGFILQDFGLIRCETVLDNVITPMLFAHGSTRNMEKCAMNVLEMLKMGHLAKRRVQHLSGGQCQRVAIARALVMNPGIILADEPTGALDSASSQQLMDIFQMLNRQGKTILMVTHNESLSRKCRRIIRIQDGMIMR